MAAWSVDRLGRSLQDLHEFLAELHALIIDTTAPVGNSMFQMCGVFAEFERSIIGERINAGLTRAKANGKCLGLARVDPEFWQAIRDAPSQKDNGMRKIGGEMGVRVSVVQRIGLELAQT